MAMPARGPDRHGVDDQCALADGDELHRHRRKSHPGKDVGEGCEQQPRHRLARDFKRLPPRLRDTNQNERGGDTCEAAGEQRRPLLQQQLHQRPVQRPAEGRDAKTEKSDPFAAPRRIHADGLAAWNPWLHGEPHAWPLRAKNPARRWARRISPTSFQRLVARARGSAWPRTRVTPPSQPRDIKSPGGGAVNQVR